MKKNETFTCVGKGFGAPVIPATKEEWEQMRKEPSLKAMCERIEKGDDDLKKRLPVWTPSCAEFKDNHRAIVDALQPLRRLMMDFDEKGHTNDILSQLKMKDERLKGTGVEVLLVEESVRRGTHVLVALPEGMTAEEAQTLMQEVTGFKPDEAVKDIARCIYMVPEDHTRYVNPKLFEPQEKESLECRVENSKLYTMNSTLKFRNIPYCEIIEEYWRRNGGEPAEGERNVKLHKLAVNLRAICDNRKDVLMQVMPRFGLSETELKSIVDSACKEEPKGISKVIQGIVDDLILSPKLGDDRGLNEEIDSDCSVPQPPNIGGLYKHLPIGLKESLIGVPASMHMPVLCGLMPIAGAYADNVEVEYCDGNMQHLGLMCIVQGEQASNKSVVKNAVDLWKRQLVEEDALARKREEEWKERKKARKANEKAPDDPHVLIREVPLTVSCSTLLKRMKNAQGHTLFSFGEEIDTLRKTNGAGSWSSKYDVYRLSFDRGEWGQDYNSDQAESGVVNASYNWTILGTNGAVQKCFKGENIENGLSSRVLVAEMPDASFQKMPKFGKRSLEDEAKIQEAVTRLRSCTGLINVPRLRKAIERWVEEKRVEAAKAIDHVKDTYRKRAAVIGFRCGVIFHLLTGKDKETKACLDFALMMAAYCLQQQIKTFGNTLRNQYVNAQEECQRYGANYSVFDQLPPVFTMDELRSLKRDFCSEASLRKIVSNWNLNKWIEKIDRHHWKKLNAPQS